MALPFMIGSNAILRDKKNQSVIIYLCNCIGDKNKSSLEFTTKSSIKVIFKNHLALGPYFSPNLFWSLKYYYYLQKETN